MVSGLIYTRCDIKPFLLCRGEKTKLFVPVRTDKQIGYREVRGYYTFTKEDIEKQFPAASKVYDNKINYPQAICPATVF